MCAKSAIKTRTLMAQSAKLQLRQSQGLALTPQLMQSIKLLQMGSVELNTFVLSEIEKNPLLELSAPGEDFPEERRGAIKETDHPKSETGHEGAFARVPKGAVDAGIGPGDLTFSGTANDLEAYIPVRQSLRDFLLQQAALTFRTGEEIRLANRLIDLIDSDGYLRNDLSELCVPGKIGNKAVQDVLAKVQKFDPPGVGARNLAECIQLQLIEKNRLDPAMKIFTQNLELLARRDYAKLARLCDVDHDDLIEMAGEVQALEPRPGDAFEFTPVQNIVPDIFVTAKPDGSWQIELNSFTLPKVLINREYYAEIKDLGLGKSDKQFMVDNLQSANWLVASLDQRARTILKVATEIVKQQDLFFFKGEEFLKPLTLNKVAEQIEMHESTISRVTGNKYLSCARGIFELKYFFMSGISGKGDESGIGAQSIRIKIRNLISSETVDGVLSDEKLTQILAQEGINVARRTVTKYREALGILSSIQRRREKKAHSAN